MKQKIISLVGLLLCSSVWAENTPREPMQGGTTNPVTQHEADQSGEQKPLSELIHKKKKKPKTTIQAEPAKSTSSTPAPTTTTTPEDSKPAEPAKK